MWYTFENNNSEDISNNDNNGNNNNNNNNENTLGSESEMVWEDSCFVQKRINLKQKFNVKITKETSQETS